MSRKRLVVMRHAKSDWDSGAKTDHDRPLNHRGIHEAPKVGELLRDRGYLPELAISSDARRTSETWERIADELENPPVHFESSFYLAGVEAIRGAVQKYEVDLTAVSTLLVLGHNPGWEEAIRALSGRRVDLKTAHAAVLEARTNGSAWEELFAEEPTFELVEIVKPGD